MKQQQHQSSLLLVFCLFVLLHCLVIVDSFTATTRLQQHQQQKHLCHDENARHHHHDRTASIITQMTQQHNDDVSTSTSTSTIYNKNDITTKLLQSFITIMTIITITLSSSSTIVYADGQTNEFRFPPIDENNVNRCTVIGGSSMGQANAARDKLYDLRSCQLSNINAVGYDLSGVIMLNTDVSKANFQEAYFSKGFLRNSNFQQTDFSNAIIDRASFDGSNLSNALFTNAVLTGTSFNNANVENVDFTNAALGVYDLRNLCKNPTLKGINPITGNDTRLSAGCSS